MSKTSDRKRPAQRGNFGKFSVQKATKDFTSKIKQVIDRVACGKHDAEIGVPCFDLPRGVCNQRASMIYTGTPSERASMNNREYKRLQKEKS